jgi:hypothetical protein
VGGEEWEEGKSQLKLDGLQWELHGGRGEGVKETVVLLTL